MTYRRETPDGEHDRVTNSSSRPINEPAHKQETDRIRSLKRSDDPAVLELVPADDPLQLRCEDSDNLPVHLVDRGRKKAQRADRPAVMSNPNRRGGRGLCYRGCRRIRSQDVSSCDGDLISQYETSFHIE